MLTWLSRILERKSLAGSRLQPLPVLRVASFADLQRLAPELRARLAAAGAHEHALLPPTETAFVVPGYCCACAADVGFEADFLYAFEERAGRRLPNWRERLLCPRCRLNNRMRAVVHLFAQETGGTPDSRLYLTEQTTALFRWFSQRYPHTTGSEFLGAAVPRGATDAAGIRNEDLTRLSFADNCFDAVLSFDVLEHVPDYRAALRECLRCLKPDGVLLLSVPFRLDAADTLVRARREADGSVTHLLPPEYHGDPLSDAGCLCYYHFGWELLDELRDLGFAAAEVLLYWSAEFGYLGGQQLLIVARKAP